MPLSCCSISEKWLEVTSSAGGHETTDIPLHCASAIRRSARPAADAALPGAGKVHSQGERRQQMSTPFHEAGADRCQRGPWRDAFDLSTPRRAWQPELHPGLGPCRNGPRRELAAEEGFLKRPKNVKTNVEKRRHPGPNVLSQTLTGRGLREHRAVIKNIWLHLENTTGVGKGNHNDSLHQKACYSITLHMNLIATEMMKIWFLVYTGMRVQLSTVTQVHTIVYLPGLLKKLLTAPTLARNKIQILL